jgi:hypothetical protein
MKTTTTLLAVILVFAACPAYAIWEISDKGAWPKSWPKELEPLRKQSGTIIGGLIELVVDGKVVDLNRIPLPADTPIIDMRFTDSQKNKTAEP